MKRVVAFNENGSRIGEGHPRAVLTDAEVDILLEMRDEGWSLGRLAAKFEITKGAVSHICSGRRRCQTPAKWVEREIKK